MREFAKEFYLSKAWRKVREYIFHRDAGLCVRCGDVGEIVHHKVHLTPANLSDSDVALGEDNLELLCRVCHTIEHSESLPTDRALTFDAEGNLVKRFEKL